VEFREPTWESGNVSLRCQICGVWESSPIDQDGRAHFISALVEFGPNALDGVVNETGIISYLIYRVDECNRRIGDVLAIVNASLESDGMAITCCPVAMYAAEVNLELDENTTTAALMIVPNTMSNTTAGTFGVGMPAALQLFDDVFRDETSRPSGVTAAALRTQARAALGFVMVSIPVWRFSYHSP
jgi:hypothetical protein